MCDGDDAADGDNAADGDDNIDDDDNNKDGGKDNRSHYEDLRKASQGRRREDGLWKFLCDHFVGTNSQGHSIMASQRSGEEFNLVVK